MQRDDVVLYTYDLAQRILVFLSVPSKQALWQEPFLDRGVRKLAADRVYVCSLDTADQYLQQENQMPSDTNDVFLFVWNTGRCGSTLLSRLTTSTGQSVTLSEPDWVDQLGKDRARLESDQDVYDSLVRILHVVDFHLARTILPSNSDHSKKIIYSLNPKGSASFLREPISRVFPNAKHMFMYRDMRKVIESFGSIFSQKPKWPMIQAKVDELIGGPTGGKPGGAPVSKSLQQQELKLPSKMISRFLGKQWLDGVLSWKEFAEALGDVPSITLRMDEFVTKDLQKREANVKEILRFAEMDVDDSELVQRAMTVFGTNSQAGSAMSKSSSSTGKKFFSSEDINELVELCAQVPQIGEPSFVIPGSLGSAHQDS